MDINQKKPIHMKCPKCGYDFAFNGNKIVQEKQAVAREIQSLLKSLTKLKEEYGSRVKNMPEHKRLQAKIEDARLRAQALNNLNRNLSENAEIQKNSIFYKKVKSILGDERTVKLMMEAEDELVYRDYDMAIQKYTNFDGV